MSNPQPTGTITEQVLAVYKEIGQGDCRAVNAKLPQYTEVQIRNCLVNAVMRKTLVAVARGQRTGSRGTTPMVYEINKNKPAKGVRKVLDVPRNLPVASVFEMGERIAANRPCWGRRNARQDFATPEAA